MTRQRTTIPPRMLTAEQAAAYLGYATTGLLENIPVKPVKMAVAGPGSQPKYDRVALDTWLDGLSGLSVPASKSGAGEPVNGEAAYADWKASRVAR